VRGVLAKHNISLCKQVDVMQRRIAERKAE